MQRVPASLIQKPRFRRCLRREGAGLGPATGPEHLSRLSYGSVTEGCRWADTAWLTEEQEAHCGPSEMQEERSPSL